MLKYPIKADLPPQTPPKIGGEAIQKHKTAKSVYLYWLLTPLLS
jgi:hypothetical protein